jgi:hypothetical protein
MGLRCRKGDMAIVLDPRHTAYGWIVTVLEIYPLARFRGRGLIQDIWEIEHENLSKDSSLPWGCEDKHLLPIRPGDLHETEESEKEIQNA